MVRKNFIYHLCFLAVALFYIFQPKFDRYRFGYVYAVVV